MTEQNEYTLDNVQDSPENAFKKLGLSDTIVNGTIVD